MSAAWIVGLDLAWGDRNGDGVCLLHAEGTTHVRVMESAHVFGDAALLAWLEARVPRDAPALLCLDAPVVCPNATGSRPVDRLAQQMFARFHAGPHPANRSRCGRVLRVVESLRARLGCEIGWELREREKPRLLLEVFPHPALVRMLGLPRIVRYKRKPGRSAEFCRGEFARLQNLLRAWLARACPELDNSPALEALLSAPLDKPAEDRLDALICALVGYAHWRGGGGATEVIGEREGGFILLPRSA